MSWTGSWTPATAGDVSAGDRVWLRAVESTVSRVDRGFLGDPSRPAFVEDTAERRL